MYWSLHDNTIQTYFLGHTDEILSLEVSNTQILSTSRDEEVRLWDFQDSKCTAVFRDSRCACFDNTGMVICIANCYQGQQNILLYNSQEIESKPISIFELPEFKSTIVQMKFSSDGQNILLISQEGPIMVINAFSGAAINQFDKISNENDVQVSADFTPDSKFIVVCGEDRMLDFWNF